MQKWTPDEQSLLEKYYLNVVPGVFSTKDIADLLGKSINAISLYAERAGYALLRKERFKDVKYCSSCKKLLPITDFSARGKDVKTKKSKCKKCFHDLYVSNYNKHLKMRNDRRKNPDLLKHDLLKQKNYKKKHLARILWLGARKRAKQQGIEFNITPADIVFTPRCPLLRVKLDFNSAMYSRDYSPSLDRIISSLGYTKNNIWVVSYRANRIKNNASLEELKLIAKNLQKKCGR